MRRERSHFVASFDSGAALSLGGGSSSGNNTLGSTNRGLGGGFKSIGASTTQIPSAGAIFQQQQSPKGLWAGSWTSPFDGGGRTRLSGGGICQAIYNFRLYQSVVNAFETDGFYLRSTQDGIDWELWQRTRTHRSKKQTKKNLAEFFLILFFDV
jgi:hypothetical protein